MYSIIYVIHLHIINNETMDKALEKFRKQPVSWHFTGETINKVKAYAKDNHLSYQEAAAYLINKGLKSVK